jgi:hypothetical protein
MKSGLRSPSHYQDILQYRILLQQSLPLQGGLRGHRQWLDIEQSNGDPPLSNTDKQTNNTELTPRNTHLGQLGQVFETMRVAKQRK